MNNQIDRKKLGKKSKNKGKNGEREVAQLIRKFGFTARRGQQFHGSSDSPDVKSSIPDTHLEVKRTETLSVYKAMEQAEEDKGPGEKAVVFHRRNNKEWLVILKAEDYLAMESKLIDSEDI
jgi:Holliday junction resolvase